MKPQPNTEADRRLAEILGWQLVDPGRREQARYYCDALGQRRSISWSPTSDANDRDEVIAHVLDQGYLVREYHRHIPLGSSESHSVEIVSPGGYRLAAPSEPTPGMALYAAVEQWAEGRRHG
jgi:hypothetical protein